MLRYYTDPKWGQIGGSFNSTSSPFVGVSTTPIGIQSSATQHTTASKFCLSHGYYYDSSFLYTTSLTVAYYNESAGSWRTKNDNAFLQITCDDGLYATSSADINIGSTTINSAYNGPSFHEWLLVAGIVLFFLSFITWSRISFTKEI